MGFTNLQEFERTLPGTEGTTTLTCALSGTADWVIVMTSSGGGVATAETLTADGNSVTRQASYRHGFGGQGGQRMSQWFYTFASPVSGSIDIAFSYTPANVGDMYAIFGTNDGGDEATVVHTGEGGGLVATYNDVWSGSGSREYIALAATGSPVFTKDVTTNGGMTCAYARTIASGVGTTFWVTGGSTTTTQTGTQTTSHGTTTSLSVAWMVVEAQALVATPDAVDIDVTVNTPGTTFDTNFYERIPAVDIDVTVQEVTAVVRRHRHLQTVADHQDDMPGRVASPTGLTTPYLGHDGVEPYWVDLALAFPNHKFLLPLTTVNASGDPEIVWDGDDDIIYVDYEEDAP